MRKKDKKHSRRRIILRLPDLDHAKSSCDASTIYRRSGVSISAYTACFDQGWDWLDTRYLGLATKACSTEQSGNTQA
jgi:hypothetical protein